MALPAGITTATVLFGKDFDVLGGGNDVTLRITPSHTLIWEATGDRLTAFDVAVSAESDTVGTFELPHTDQAGFINEAGAEITDWWYTIVGTVRAGRAQKTYTKRVQVSSDVTSFDLDTLPINGSVGPVGSVPLPTITSVNGQTGAVVLTASAIGAIPNTSEGRQALAESTELSATIEGAVLPYATRERSGVSQPIPSDVVTLFASGHSFVGTGGTGAGQIADDPTTFATGSQSLAVTTLSDNSPAMVRRSTLPAMDATGKSLAVTLRIEDVSQLTELLIYASSDTFSSFYLWSLQTGAVTDAQKWFKSGEFQTITLGFGSATVTGTPNRAALTGIQLRARLANGHSTVIRYDRVALVPEGSRPVVSITTDDVYASNWSLMRPALDNFGWGATLYAIPSRATSGLVSVEQMHRLEDVNGWEIAGHGATNLTSMSLADAETDVVAMREWLRTNGFRGVDHYSYPNGGFSPAVEGMMRRYYRAARTIVRPTVETLPPANPYRLRSYEPNPATSVANVVAQTVTAAKNSNGWSILLFHDLTTSGSPGALQYPMSQFEQILQGIKDAGVDCKPVGEVLAGM